jgi:hypothetical protein
MTDQACAGGTSLSQGNAQVTALPESVVRLAGALLAVGVAAVHVADQGGVTAFDAPDWIGWGYRLIEAGGVLTALALLLPPILWLGLTRLRWAAGLLLGAGPFAAYVVSRTVGMPGDHADIGNWGYWLGTVSLVIEAALTVLCAGMLLALRPRSSPVSAA